MATAILKISIKDGTSGLIIHTNLLEVPLNLRGNTGKTSRERVRKIGILLPHCLATSNVNSGKNWLSILPTDRKKLIGLRRLNKVLAN
jgi:hypothetical protein